MKTANKFLILIYSSIFIVVIAFFALIWHKKNKIKDTFYPAITSKNLVPANFINQPYLYQQKRLLLILSLDCDYCSEILKYTEDNRKIILEKYQVIIALHDSTAKIQQFYKQHKTIIDAGVKIYNDEHRYLFNYLQIKAYPSIFILRDDKIVKEGNGSENIKIIMNQLK